MEVASKAYVDRSISNLPSPGGGGDFTDQPAPAAIAWTTSLLNVDVSNNALTQVEATGTTVLGNAVLRIANLPTAKPGAVRFLSVLIDIGVSANYLEIQSGDRDVRFHADFTSGQTRPNWFCFQLTFSDGRKLSSIQLLEPASSNPAPSSGGFIDQQVSPYPPTNVITSDIGSVQLENYAMTVVEFAANTAFTDVVLTVLDSTTSSYAGDIVERFMCIIGLQSVTQINSLEIRNLDNDTLYHRDFPPNHAFNESYVFQVMWVGDHTPKSAHIILPDDEYMRTLPKASHPTVPTVREDGNLAAGFTILANNIGAMWQKHYTVDFMYGEDPITGVTVHDRGTPFAPYKTFAGVLSEHANEHDVVIHMLNGDGATLDLSSAALDQWSFTNVDGTLSPEGTGCVINELILPSGGAVHDLDFGGIIFNQVSVGGTGWLANGSSVTFRSCSIKGLTNLGMGDNLITFIECEMDLGLHVDSNAQAAAGMLSVGRCHFGSATTAGILTITGEAKARIAGNLNVKLTVGGSTTVTCVGGNEFKCAAPPLGQHPTEFAVTLQDAAWLYLMDGSCSYTVDGMTAAIKIDGSQQAQVHIGALTFNENESEINDYADADDYKWALSAWQIRNVPAVYQYAQMPPPGPENFTVQTADIYTSDGMPITSNRDYRPCSLMLMYKDLAQLTGFDVVAGTAQGHKIINHLDMQSEYNAAVARGGYAYDTNMKDDEGRIIKRQYFLWDEPGNISVPPNSEVASSHIVMSGHGRIYVHNFAGYAPTQEHEKERIIEGERQDEASVTFDFDESNPGNTPISLVRVNNETGSYDFPGGRAMLMLEYSADQWI